MQRKWEEEMKGTITGLRTLAIYFLEKLYKGQFMNSVQYK